MAEAYWAIFAKQLILIFMRQILKVLWILRTARMANAKCP